MMRELKTRFGEYHLGYAWAILEPFAHVAILSLLFATVRQRDFYGIDAPLFVTLGIVPWLLFRHTVGEAMDAIKANRGLFDHRQVKPLDAVFARSVLEIVIHFVVYALFIVGIWWLGFEVPKADYLQVFCILFLLSLLSFNFGLMASVTGAIYKESRKFIRVLLRPMYFISGVFFSIEMIPREAWPFILWNPVLHALDLLKGASIPEYESPASWGYLVGTVLVTACMSLMMYRASLHRLLRA